MAGITAISSDYLRALILAIAAVAIWNALVFWLPPAASLRRRRERRQLFTLGAILAVALGLRLADLHQPFVDAFSWRQVSVAMIAENYYRTSPNIFFPEVNWGGPGPNYQGREFQTMGYGAALLYHLFGQHDEIGRLLAVAFGLWGIVALHGLVRRAWGDRYALAAAGVMAVMPGAVAFERSFLPDPAMVALVVSCAWMFVAYLQTGKSRYLVLTTLFGVWGGATKITGLIIGLPLLYAALASLGSREFLRPRRLAALLLCGVSILVPVAAYYLWARHLALSYPPYHFAGAGNWIWERGLLLWLDQYYFLPAMSWDLRTWIWSLPVIGLAVIGLLLPLTERQPTLRRAPRLRWLFHWWLLAGLVFYSLGAQEIAANPWNSHVVSPAIAALAGLGMLRLADLLRRLMRLPQRAFVSAMLLLIALVGVRGLSVVHRSWAVESLHLGRALQLIAAPNDLAITIGHDFGDPVPLYYAQLRGWGFPPPDSTYDWTVMPADDAVATRLFDDLRAQGGRWLGIVGEQLPRMRQENAAFLEHVTRTSTLVAETPAYTIFYIGGGAVPAIPASLPVSVAIGPNWLGDTELGMLFAAALILMSMSFLLTRSAWAQGLHGRRQVPSFVPVAEGVLPPISVVVCTRERPEQLARCLAALAKLDYPDYEVIVVDNGSLGRAAADLAHEHGYRYVREERVGLNWARLRGLAAARHEFIAYTDDDAQPAIGWLRGIAQGFSAGGFAAVTGLVVAAELSTVAQRLFEAYGGMGKGSTARSFRGNIMTAQAKLAAHNVGVGANMAFRRAALAAVGGFDPSLDVGTPAQGGGDIDIFHRLLAAGMSIRYEPEAVVQHEHRRELAALRRQIGANGRAFGVYLIRTYIRGSVGRAATLRFSARWFGGWVLKRCLLTASGRLDFPVDLALAELRGALMAPVAYLAARRYFKQVRSGPPLRHWRREPGYIADMITTLVGRELQIRYKGSLLGLSWAVLCPLGTVAALVLVFVYVVPLNIDQYPVFVYCGLLPWTWFAASIQLSSSTLIDNRDLVRRPFFQRQLLPAVVMSANFVLYLLALPVLLLLLWYEGIAFTPALLLLPLVWIVQALLTLAFSVLFAALGVVVRDIQHLLGVGLLFWFYLTPIFYDVDRLPAQTAQWLLLNPMTVIVQAHRRIALDGQAPDWIALGAWTLAALLMLVLAVTLFRALEDVLVEEV